MEAILTIFKLAYTKAITQSQARLLLLKLCRQTSVLEVLHVLNSISDYLGFNVKVYGDPFLVFSLFLRMANIYYPVKLNIERAPYEN